MGWKFQCSLCAKKFGNKESGNDHVAIHSKNGKVAVLKPYEPMQPDYSDAEYELHTRYGI